MQCQQHKEEKLALYCFDCKVPVCYLCKEYGHHKGHQVELLEPVFKNTKVSKTHIRETLIGNASLHYLTVNMVQFLSDGFEVNTNLKCSKLFYSNCVLCFIGGTGANIRHSNKEELSRSKDASILGGDVHHC